MPVIVRGYTEFLKAAADAPRNTREFVREAFRPAGEIVRKDAARAFAPVNTKTAVGFRTRVRQRGVAVAQSMRKVTGEHPEYGARQVRYLHFSARRNRAAIEQEFERALDKVAHHFETVP